MLHGGFRRGRHSGHKRYYANALLVSMGWLDEVQLCLGRHSATVAISKLAPICAARSIIPTLSILFQKNYPVSFESSTHNLLVFTVKFDQLGQQEQKASDCDFLCRAQQRKPVSRNIWRIIRARKQSM